MREHVARKIGGDHDFRAERTRGRKPATGLTSAPSTSQRSPTITGEKIPGSA